MDRKLEAGHSLIFTTLLSVSLRKEHSTNCSNRAVERGEIKDCVVHLTALRLKGDKLLEMEQGCSVNPP